MGQECPDFVAYHFLDAAGELMATEEDGKNTEKFLKEGLTVDGSSIKGMMSVENSDLKLMPEADSYQTIRMDGFVHHRFQAHLVDENGDPHPRDPRGILKRLVDKAHDMGFEPEMFSEVEFFLADQDGKPADTGTYCSLPPDDKSFSFRQELGKICKELGMKVKRIHHEVGCGQNEIELNLTPCMKNADDTVLCMWVMKLLAAKRNQTIVFSPKPFPNDAGNGLHHHVMLRDLKTGENIFKNPASLNEPLSNHERLSDLCGHGIAGLLTHADEITAVFAASNETFARLRPGFEAPIFKTWGFSNRTALVRVPKTGLDSTRFEYRGGDLSGSVHLFGAVLLAAVLSGIEEKLEPPSNADFNVEQLTKEELGARDIHPVPLSFEECIHVLKNSTFLRESLGQEMVDFLIERDEELLASSPAEPRNESTLPQHTLEVLHDVARKAKRIIFSH